MQAFQTQLRKRSLGQQIYVEVQRHTVENRAERTQVGQIQIAAPADFNAGKSAFEHLRYLLETVEIHVQRSKTDLRLRQLYAQVRQVNAVAAHIGAGLNPVSSKPPASRKSRRSISTVYCSLLSLGIYALRFRAVRLI